MLGDKTADHQHVGLKAKNNREYKIILWAKIMSTNVLLATSIVLWLFNAADAQTADLGDLWQVSINSYVEIKQKISESSLIPISHIAKFLLVSPSYKTVTLISLYGGTTSPAAESYTL